MIYRVRDIICVKEENTKFVPYAFNNNGSKIKNLFTNEIIELGESLYKTYNMNRWQEKLTPVNDVFSKIFNNFKMNEVESLKDVLYNIPISKFWIITHKNLINTIVNGCDESIKENFFIEDKKIKSLVNERNHYLETEKSNLNKKEKLNIGLEKEAELTQEF